MSFNGKDSNYNDKILRPLQDNVPPAAAQGKNENETGQEGVEKQKDLNNKENFDIRTEAKADTRGCATKMRGVMKKEVDEMRDALSLHSSKEINKAERNVKKKKDPEQELQKAERARLEKESRDLALRPDAVDDWFHKTVPEAGFFGDQAKEAITSKVETNFDKYMGEIKKYIQDPGIINDAKNIIKNILIRYYFVEDNSFSGDKTESFAIGLGKKLEPLFFNFQALQQSYPQEFSTTQNVLEAFSEFAGIPIIKNGGLDENNFTKIALMKGKNLNDLFMNFSRYTEISTRLKSTQSQNPSFAAGALKKGEKTGSNGEKPDGAMTAKQEEGNENYDEDDDQKAAAAENTGENRPAIEKADNLSEENSDAASQALTPASGPSPKFQTIPDSPTPALGTSKGGIKWLEEWFNKSPFMKKIVDFLSSIMKFFKGL